MKKRTVKGKRMSAADCADLVSWLYLVLANMPPRRRRELLELPTRALRLLAVGMRAEARAEARIARRRAA